MNRLRYPQKFMLVSGVFILPILILLFFTWSTLREDIQFAKTEQDGVQVLQMATRQLNAIVANQKPPLISAQETSQIKDLVSSLSADKEYQALRSATDSQQVQDAALQLIARINDTSNLILDPELASYFVGDVTIGKLPLLMTLVAQLASQNANSPEAKLRAQTIAPQISGLAADLQVDIDKAAAAQPEALKATQEQARLFQAAIHQVLSEYQDRIASPLVNNKPVDENISKLKERIQVATTAGTQLSEAGLKTLDALLQQRIDQRSNKLGFAIGISLFAIIAAILLQIGFFLSTKNNINLLNQSFSQISLGEFNHVTQLKGKDELAALNQPIHTMLDTLRRFSTAQLHMAAAHDAGDIHHTIDDTQFCGGYQEMAMRINELVRSHTAIQMKMVALTSLYTQGEFSVSIENMKGLKAMITDEVDKVRDRMHEASIAADFTLKIKQALDQVTTPVMISDANDFPMYQNQAAEQQLGPMPQQTLKHVLNAGQWLDWRSGHASQGQIIRQGSTFRVNVTPIFNEEHTLIGHVTEWQDQTAELAMGTEISQVVSAAATGVFSQRIRLDNKIGFYADLGMHLNGLLDQTQSSLSAFGKALIQLAEGDLTHSLPTNYQGIFGELAHSTNRTTHQLNQIINDIRSATSEVANSAIQVTQTSASLLEKTQSQAAATEKTAASANEVASAVQQNADHAGAAATLVRSAHEEAEVTRTAMTGVQEAMKKLTESAKKIADITGLIDGIAFQTNILALNAAVEAARAGDAGRGFAVVAAEVRNLAQKSGDAAREIRSLIENSVREIHQGHTRVEQSATLMHHMHEQVQQLSFLISDIANASKEQLSGVNEISHALSQIDHAGQQNQSLASQQTHNAENMQKQAERLNQTVAIFKI
ncbi:MULTISPECIES: methyl-accepting chemotaxis protein [Deefgea]|nr:MULTISPECIES: methyl-accepting chemotaxis protein [Deefgea]MBM9889607.1 hypothetical protein [Deefgea sp. CFH1-16]